ncbi:MAG: hypothetical protein UFG06_14020 [Lachnospiraceae bacterium]|nr:hypothetical protein [Lachnospiraceae bacterium]
MFGFYRNNANPNFPAIVTLPTTESTTYKVGDALALSSGKLAKATGTTKPAYICAEEYTAPASGQKEIAVYPIFETQEWKTTFAAEPKDIVPGSKVTIHTDGAQVTATTTSGVAEVVRMLGTASGSEVIVKF